MLVPLKKQISTKIDGEKCVYFPLENTWKSQWLVREDRLGERILAQSSQKQGSIKCTDAECSDSESWYSVRLKELHLGALLGCCLWFSFVNHRQQSQIRAKSHTSLDWKICLVFKPLLYRWWFLSIMVPFNEIENLGPCALNRKNN